jgi:hypothetical protein
MASEGKADCAASIGGKFLSNPPFLRFARRNGGKKRKTSEEQKKTPAPMWERKAPYDCQQSAFPSEILE